MSRTPKPRSIRTDSTPWAWALAGALLGVLLALLVYAPARWLTAALQQASHDRVLFQEVRGTFWSGSAQLTLTGGLGSSDAATLPGRLAWQLHPGATGLTADVQADCCLAQAWRWQLQPQWGGAKLALADSQSQWPAKLLTGLGTPWNTIQADGQLTLSTQSLIFEWAQGRLLLAGQAQVDAAQLASRLTTLKPMGSYRITVLGGAAPALTLETLQGSLQLSGKGQWVGAKFRFNGEASAEPQHQDALSNLLNIIGRRDGTRAIIKVG